MAIQNELLFVYVVKLIKVKHVFGQDLNQLNLKCNLDEWPFWLDLDIRSANGHLNCNSYPTTLGFTYYTIVERFERWE